MRSWTGRCSIDRRGALRVLVTGGAGFIGGHLTEFFKNHGADVTVLDDLSGGTPERLPPGVELAEADIADASTEETVRRLRPEVVVHAAAQVSVVRSVAHPARDHAVNVDGTRHVLAGAAPSARRVVFLSSGGAVYGEANLAAEDDPVAPESPYGKNKLAAERLVTSWGIPYAIARLANVYGPGQRSDLEGGVVAVFIERIRSRSPLIIHGDGEQRRDFIHVADVVRAIAAMTGTDGSGVWNLGTGVATSINELADVLEKVAGSPLHREHRQARAGEVTHSSLLIRKARDELSWEPAIDLERGVQPLLGVVPELDLGR
jgi:UDP-glucose 4-epimerase